MKTVISSSDKTRLNLSEVLNYRDLLKNIAFRDITVRYKQTWLGIIWAVIRPLFNIVVFGAISMLISKSTDAKESFLMVGSGVIFWNLMVTCVTESSNSLVSNGNLLTKVYFPKIILPVSSVIVCVVDFAVSFLMFLLLFIILKGFPGVQFFLLPVFVLMAVTFCLGFGLIFSALNVKYRDVNFALPFFLQFAYYVSPVFLTTSFYLSYLPEWAQKVFLLNPLVFLIDGFRFCLYGTWPHFDMIFALSSVLIIFIVIFFGLRHFLKFEKSFADFI